MTILSWWKITFNIKRKHIMFKSVSVHYLFGKRGGNNRCRRPVIGDCPMFRRFYVQKVLCSENICSKGSMFRRFYIQKGICSEGPMFRRSYIQKVLCSEGPMFRKYLFKRSNIQKVLCSEGPIFRYIQKVLYSENSLFDVGKNLHISVSGKLQCKITNHSLSF